MENSDNAESHDGFLGQALSRINSIILSSLISFALISVTPKGNSIFLVRKLASSSSRGDSEYTCIKQNFFCASGNDNCDKISFCMPRACFQPINPKTGFDEAK